jgi:hypothetical protein
MGNYAANCDACNSSIEEKTSELHLSVNGIDETDPEQRRILIQAKSVFEQKLQKMGNFLKSQKINQILDSINPMVNKISIPENIIRTKKPNTFEEPIIRFHNGEIYKGHWNTNNQRDGFGININPDGEIYAGLWNNDQIGEYGAFFDNEGNYYKGKLINGKGNGQGEIFISNKMKYIGEFVDDIPKGKGIMINLLDGSEYNGKCNKWKKRRKRCS